MKGYLLKKENIVIGNERFIESVASDAEFAVMFEDDGETGYFYAAEKDAGTGAVTVLDMLFIYDVEQVPKEKRAATLALVWSTGWKQCALVLDDTCHAIFDFQNKAGYNLAGFPPPNIWEQKSRNLTLEIVRRYFQ